VKLVFIGPGRYVQGRGVIGEIGDLLTPLGSKPLVLWDDTVKSLFGEQVLGSIKAASLDVIDVTFEGESTKEEATRVAQLARDGGADITVGIGGGKAIDIAKAVTFDVGTKLMTVPTIAATDAPTSAASVWYDAESNFTGFECWPANPNVVLVDTQVIAGGPSRAFSAGMGDALSTWVECESAYKTRALNIAGGGSTLAAMAIARLGFDTLMEYGVEALRAVRNNVVTPAVERVVEANVLHSGLGFESGGLATAHMVANLLSNQPECSHLMHGEKVGFGIITQLVLDEDSETDEMLQIIDFEVAIGLPVTFAELGMTNVTREQLQSIGEACAGEGSLCGNHCFDVTADSVVDAMIAADALGQERKALQGP